MMSVGKEAEFFVSKKVKEKDAATVERENREAIEAEQKATRKEQERRDLIEVMRPYAEAFRELAEYFAEQKQARDESVKYRPLEMD